LCLGEKASPKVSRRGEPLAVVGSEMASRVNLKSSRPVHVSNQLDRKASSTIQCRVNQGQHLQCGLLSALSESERVRSQKGGGIRRVVAPPTLPRLFADFWRTSDWRRAEFTTSALLLATQDIQQSAEVKRTSRTRPGFVIEPEQG
jgi:hypothetical protein